jgi:hypothetical protein
MFMIESTSLALLPLTIATIVLALRFYVRENAVSVLSPTFMLAAFSVLMLVTYMVLLVLLLLPPYAWVAFGGVGLVLSVGGLWSFFR